MILIDEAGAGERVAPHHLLGQAQLLADAADLVLEQRAQRLDELEVHLLGQAADVVVRLDLRRDARLAARLDHVRVERPLDEERRPPEPSRLLLEHPDELLPHAAPLLLGVGDALEPGQEPLLGVDVDERARGSACESLDDLRGLVLAQEPMVDEDAGELVADSLVDEQCGDRRVDAARERAEHALAADLRADPLDLLLDHRGRRPRRRHPGGAVEEVLEHLLAVRRMHDLGVELHPVETALRRLERCDGRGRRLGGDRRALGRRRDRVAVAHPGGLLLRQPREERARRTCSGVLPNSETPVARRARRDRAP